MSRPRGNATSKVHREFRKSTVVEKLQDTPNLTNKQLANETGVSLATVKRDLQTLRERFSLVTDARYEEFKKAQLAVFELIERNLVEGSVTPEVAREWRGIRSEISQLLGLNAPQRHVTTHLDADIVSMKLKKAVSGLSEEQLEQVYSFAAGLPRQKTPVVMDASWFPSPETKMLPEGESQ
jgi:predicted transcriptional regulator